MKKKYVVELTDTEREHLTAYVRKGKNAVYKIKHAHILLKTDAAGPSWPDAQIMDTPLGRFQTTDNECRSAANRYNSA